METCHSNMARRWALTLLDFMFRHKNVTYNFPTIINYQVGYDMFVIWQACRRHHRLNQTEECRTYFLVSFQTIQPDAVELVASKQVATSAIQGQFSSEGLCAMARGVDPRIRLAQAVSEKSETQERGLKGMFDVLNKNNNSGKDMKQNYIPMATFYELTGIQEYDSKKGIPGVVSTGLGENFNLFSMLGKKTDPEAEKTKKMAGISPLIGLIEKNLTVISQEPSVEISDQAEVKPLEEKSLEEVKTNIGSNQTNPELPETKSPKPDVSKINETQKTEKQMQPDRNDLFSVFFVGSAVSKKKEAATSETAGSDVLWKSLAMGLEKGAEKKSKTKKSGLVSLFRNRK